jgi:hypothetical protein
MASDPRPSTCILGRILGNPMPGNVERVFGIAVHLRITSTPYTISSWAPDRSVSTEASPLTRRRLCQLNPSFIVMGISVLATRARSSTVTGQMRSLRSDWANSYGKLFIWRWVPLQQGEWCDMLDDYGSPYQSAGATTKLIIPPAEENESEPNEPSPDHSVISSR